MYVVEVAQSNSRKDSVRKGICPVTASGELEGIVANLRSAPIPSPRKTLIKTPTPISPLPSNMRKTPIFPQPPQPAIGPAKIKEIKGYRCYLIVDLTYTHALHTWFCNSQRWIFCAYWLCRKQFKQLCFVSGVV